MTDTDRAYEALGQTRSELARYKQQNAEQQRRIRELESMLRTVDNVVLRNGVWNNTELRDKVQAVLKG